MDLSTDPVSAFLIQISLIMSNGSNISAHIKEFSNILESRLPHGVKNSAVSKNPDQLAEVSAEVSARGSFCGSFCEFRGSFCEFRGSFCYYNK